jgi:hypothetical protein
MRVHFGSVTQQCSTQQQTDARDSKVMWQPQADALYPIDTKALIPKCVGKSLDGKTDIVIYEQGENIWLWVSVGLVGLLFLILIFAALKGGGQSGPIIYR